MRTILLALLMVAQGSAQTRKTLYQFDGALPSPYGALAIGKGGVLYGTTVDGGADGSGTIYSVTPPAASGGAWAEQEIFEFGSTGPVGPVAGVVVGPDGGLYGTTYAGGDAYEGTVYSLTPPAAAGGVWTETTLHSFNSATGDGGNPWGGVVLGADGVLYGTTVYGGTSVVQSGTVYSLNPPAAAGGAWTETVLYSFADLYAPAYPYGGVIVGGNGVLYGTTFELYEYFGGAAFSLTPPASEGAPWTESTLHEFTGTGDGRSPYAGLAIDGHGVLYGVTMYGGAGTSCTNGCGTVFSLTPPSFPNGPSTETVLYSFTGGAGGWYPDAKLAVGKNGVLFGTTLHGGNGDGGTVFSLTPPRKQGGAWTWKMLYGFNASTNGYWPSPVTIGKGGVLFGATYAFPSAVYELLP